MDVRDPPLTPDANHVWRPGVMRKSDLRSYRAPLRAPTQVRYRGLDVYGMGPPSSGGSTVGEALNILEGFPMSALPREQSLHYYLEASRYSFADRNAYLGDRDFVPVPLEGLLSESFAAERNLITEEAAESPVPPGDPWPYQPGRGSASSHRSATVERDGSTTHIAASDRWGNVASYTYTIESVGGNGITVLGWGFLLNNALTHFNYAEPGHPNGVEGGKRPRSSMSPTIVLAGGEPVVALGSPGGSTIITTVLQLLVYQVDFGMTLPEAIAAPRLSQRNTSATLAEPEFMDSPLAEALEAPGPRVHGDPGDRAATGIRFLPGGVVVAAAEPTRRGGGTALVEQPA